MPTIAVSSGDIMNADSRRLYPSMSFFATCPLYLESLLADELVALGAQSVQATQAGVAFEGPLECAYRAVLWSRLASRILMPLGTFEIADESDIYAAVMTIDWPEVFAVDQRFALSFSARRSRLKSPAFATLKAKDAIVDQFRDRGGRRPDVDTDDPQVRIDLFADGGQLTVSLDLAGRSLHQRGYRDHRGSAPLKENLAAALLMRAGWPQMHGTGAGLMDPFCGSGTIVIEGALMAADIAPGSLHSRYGLHGWRQHDTALWHQLTREVRERRQTGLDSLDTILVGSDRDPDALAVAQRSGRRAGLDEVIQWRQQPMHQARPATERGLVLSNPPWGERLGDELALTPLYHRFGQVLREQFAAWDAAVLTRGDTLGRAMGLHAGKDYRFRHGPLDCRLLLFGTIADQRPPAASGIDMLSNRLVKNQRRLRHLTGRDGVTCYRLYDADLPEYNAAVDVYGEHLHIQEYQAPKDIPINTAQRRLRELVTAAALHADADSSRIHIKTRQRQRGDEQYERQARTGEFLTVREGGLKFLVNLDDYLDTGLFADHRITRGMIRDLAPQREVLNLFCYTATASVYAAAGGATAVTSVDLSRTYLDWGKRNFEINGLADYPARFIRADVMDWVAGEQASYDLIFVDPPTFSNSKSMTDSFDIQRDHPALLADCVKRLKPGGVLIFSCNARRFDMQFDDEAWQSREITGQTLPVDFQRARTHHRAWRIEAAAAQST